MKKLLVIALFVFPFYLPAMQPSQGMIDRSCERKKLERLQVLLPRNQVHYFIDNLDRIFNERHKFRDPLFVYLENDVVVGIYFALNQVAVQKKQQSNIPQTLYMRPDGFADLLQKIKKTPQTID